MREFSGLLAKKPVDDVVVAKPPVFSQTNTGKAVGRTLPGLLIPDCEAGLLCMKLPMKQMRPSGVDHVGQSGIGMPCKSCGSVDQKKFSAEMAIHFPGLKNIDKPAVWVFPELVVCFDCGTAEFAVPEEELRLLARDAAAAAG
jgi:hypothetical protein